MRTKTRALAGALLVVSALAVSAARLQAEVAGPAREHAVTADLDKLDRERPAAARAEIDRARLSADIARAVGQYVAGARQAQLAAFYAAAAQQDAARAAMLARRAAAARRIAAPGRGGRTDGTLACIRHHESDTSGGYAAVNRSSGAGGAYQVLPSTWAGYAGYARAQDAPPAVQDRWAREALATAGTRPWAGSGC